MSKFSVVYYTDGTSAPAKLRAYCFDLLCKTVSELGGEVIAVSNNPGDRRCHENLYRNILRGLDQVQCDIVFLAEHDMLYPPSHFGFVPSNGNVWYDEHTACLNKYGFFAHPHKTLLSAACGRKAGLRAAIQNKLDETLAAKTNSPVWAEPPGETYSGADPVVDIRHGRNFTGMRVASDGGYESSLAPWGDAREYIHLFDDGKAEIPPPAPVARKRPDVLAACCCAIDDPSAYLCVNGKWYQVVAFQLNPTQVRTTAWPAVACHRCGTKLGEKTEPHKWGMASYLDDNVVAIAGKG